MSVLEISDNVHETIRLNGLAAKIINNVYFDRLSQISQVGFVSKVYPNATHTRKAHSMGVAHLAKKWIAHLKTSGIISERVEELIVTAALCHDLGHVALSHTIDDGLCPEIFDNDNTLNPQLRTHEGRSIYLLKLINVDIKLGISEHEMNFIEACIMGKPLEGYPKWYFQIVSGFIDCDRLDYLKRDGLQTGMPKIRINRILMNAKIIDDELAFDKKVAPDILQIAQTRQYYHFAIYQHKTVLKYNLMTLDLLRKNKKHFNLDKMFSDDSWIFFTDSQFWAQLYKLRGKNKLADRILNRDLYKLKITDKKRQTPSKLTSSINLGGGKNPDIISQILFHDNGKIVKIEMKDLALRPMVQNLTRYCYAQ